MPKIKSYPIYKKFLNKKSLTEISKQTVQSSNIVETEEDDNDDQNSIIGNSINDNASNSKFKIYKKIKGDYSIYWYLQPNQCNWKPDAREGQSLVTEGKHAYLFGGIGKELYNQIAELDLTNFKWQILKQVQGNIPSARYGHSCNIYRRNIIIFGGQQRSNQTVLKTRELLQDVYFLNIDTLTWKLINCQGGPLQQRRNHASAIIGRNMLIHGGINNKEQTLKDLWILDLVWVEALTKWAANIQYEGLYAFGGRNNKGDILGDLKILKTDCKPLQWIKIETKGVLPKPRHSHSQNFSQHYNFLIIYGGQNDNDSQVFYNDMHLLNVDDLNWIKVTSNSYPAISRSSHSACIFDTKFIVFGGINIDGLIPSLLSIGEL
ncbi:kelch motif family protein, putative, partial [Ichthyophthirius multifiliis]